MRINGLSVSLDKKMVLNFIDCREGSPVLKEVLSSYATLEKKVLDLAEPQVIYDFGTIGKEDATDTYPEGTEVIYVISTIGSGIEKMSAELFEKGEYLSGILAGAMADSCLFSLEPYIHEELKKVCSQKNYGITERLEAPDGIGIKIQKTAYERLNAEEYLGMKITSGYMYDPVKSNCQIYVISPESCEMRLEHDCSKCSSKNCRLRLPEITVKEQNRSLVIKMLKDENILEALRRSDVYINAVCSGRGTCGKCRIKIISGNLLVTAADKNAFTDEELRAGYRLACKAVPLENAAIEIVSDDNEKIDVLTHTGEKHDKDIQSKYFGIAVDIGTTTIAMKLVGLESGKEMGSYTSINHQSIFGADVISRIQSACSGNKSALQNIIREDIDNGIISMLEESRINKKMIRKVVIAGNTTMGHLLMGYDCTGLGVSPFRPVNISLVCDRYKNIIGKDTLDCDVYMLPGISAYVGADIVSGIYALGMNESEKICVLLDIGTNGEMAIGNRDRILVTSTAAGPAFEGGNISCGTGSIPGAICSVKIDEKREPYISTILQKPPVGICGTGIIETIYELRKCKIIDDTGLLDEKYLDEGYILADNTSGKKISCTQKDIRELQLAKSAVRAGLELVIKRYGGNLHDLYKIYLAGGFGYRIDCKKAAGIGMLPKQLTDNTEAVGNASLSGCIRFMMDEGAADKLKNIVCNSSELTLASDKEFNDMYMEYMRF